MTTLVDFNNASWILSKVLSLGYFVAFLSLTPQLLGLFGRQGILSIDHLLNILDKELKADRFYHVPSVFWLTSSDLALRTVCFTGMTAASLAFLGFSQSIMLLICWICYLSFVSCGQLFMSYQWDTLLLEFGFLGLFFAPFQWEWNPLGAHILHPIVYTLVLLLLFKLMFLSGVAKITTKDPTWRNFKALQFHFWTQPLPTPLGYFAHKLPPLVLQVGVGFMYVVELAAPFFIFIPGPTQIFAVGLLVLLQFLILLTGNFGFFNFLTLGLCLGVLPDSAWKFKINWLERTSQSDIPAVLLALIVVPPTLFWIYKSLFEKSKFLDFLLPTLRFFYPFRLSNPYGLFAIMTKNRPELILEGSNDGENWEEYVFSHKPVKLNTAPPIVAPHLPRLDWQLWFAGLEPFNDNLWLQNLITRIFQESPDVLVLFAKDPFKGKAPKHLRFMQYEYKYSSFKTLRTQGIWWNRSLKGPYGPTFHRDESDV